MKKAAEVESFTRGVDEARPIVVLQLANGYQRGKFGVVGEVKTGLVSARHDREFSAAEIILFHRLTDITNFVQVARFVAARKKAGVQFETRTTLIDIFADLSFGEKATIVTVSMEPFVLVVRKELD